VKLASITAAINNRTIAIPNIISDSVNCSDCKLYTCFNFPQKDPYQVSSIKSLMKEYTKLASLKPAAPAIMKLIISNIP